MTLRAGSRGYLLLGPDFKDPKWREAVVLSTEDQWMRCLVRCTQEEAESAGLTVAKKDSAHYCLVETDFSRLLSGVPSEVMKLEASNTELLKIGAEAISEGEPTFASLSDQNKPAAQRKSKKAIASSSEASSSEEAADVHHSLRQNWLGSGIELDKTKRDSSKSSREGRRRSKRFALIDKKKKASKSSKDEMAQEALLQAAMQKGDPLQGLMALQLAQSLRRRSRGRDRRRRAKSSSSRSTSRSSSSSSSDRGRSSRGRQKAVDAYTKSGRRMFAKPFKYVRRYIKDVEKEIRAEDRAWRLVDCNRKISWKNQKGIQRCHYLMCVTLEFMLRQESGSPSRLVAPSDASSRVGRRRLADRMAPCQDPGRSVPTPLVWRRCSKSPTCDRLPSFDERTRQVDGQPEEERCRKGRRRGGRKGERGQGATSGQGQKQRCQGQGEDLGRNLSAQSSDRTAQAGSENHAVIRFFEDSWGSFGRFFRRIKSSGLTRRLGPESPPAPTKGVLLFPSLLVMPESMCKSETMGKSKGARRRARRRGRDESWEYLEI